MRIKSILLLLVCFLLYRLNVPAIACPPGDCDDCETWNAETKMCDWLCSTGQCCENDTCVSSCPGCKSCVSNYCEDNDDNCSTCKECCDGDCVLKSTSECDVSSEGTDCETYEHCDNCECVCDAELTQFNADPTKFPKCQGTSISKSDFVIVTDPTGYEGDVVVTGLTTATAGTHTATATLYDGDCGSIDAAYEIVGSGEWVPVPADATIPPDPPDGSVSSSSVSIDCKEDAGLDKWYKTKVTYSGGYVWDEIGNNTVTAPDTFTTTQCKKWTLSASTSGTASVGIPMVAGASVTVTVGGSWESSTTHTLTSGPDETPYQWRYYHYQKCSGLSKTVQTWRILDPKQASFFRLQCDRFRDFTWTQLCCSSRLAG
jgi:hypothetical protein